MQTPSSVQFILIRGILAVALVCSAVLVKADNISNRKLEMLNDHYVSPWPSTNTDTADPGTEFIGKSAYALTAYYLATNRTTADAFVNTLHDASYLGVVDSTAYKDASGNDFPFEFAMPMFVRIAAGSDINGVRITNGMSATARTNLFDMLWRVMRQRSKTNDAGNSSSSVWGVLGSENHNAMWRSSFFIGAQVLNSAGYPYGAGNPRNTLADGNSLQQHSDAWNSFWFEYFRQRAREGIDIEVDSPQYEKYTLACYYNIRDFAADPWVMRPQADKFIQLYWADVANEFLVGATIRGGAGCRMYQDANLTQGTRYSFQQWLYMYDWHDTDSGSGSHPMILNAATSSFVPPAIVSAIATNASKTPYEFSSHRLGAGTDGTYGDTTFYHLSTPGYVRRDTQWTPEFVMGSMTYDSTRTYTGDSGENHFAGVIFNSGVNDRLIVQGVGTAKSNTADAQGVTSASYKETLIAALGKDAASNNGMRVFVANTLYNNLVTNGNWLLTFAGSGYAAIRIATGGYSWVTTNNDGTVCADGKYLTLGDKWSPLVIQCGRATDYGNSFASFTSSVVTNYFNWNSTSNVMTYTNEANWQLKMWRQSDNLPWVGAGPRSQSPTYLYNSPYLSATYGSTNSDVTIMYPGYTNLVLSFEFP